MRKRRAVIKVFAVFLFVSLFSCSKNGKSSADESGETIVTAVENKFTRSVDIQGYMEPNDLQKVQFRGTGAITGVFVKEGDVVKKGDLLATIDDTSQRYAYEKAKQELEKSEYSASGKEKELLEMQLKNAENNLAYTKAVALFDGVVIQVNIQEGDYAEAGKTLDLIQLVDVSCLKATVQIDEIDMKVIHKGMKVSLDFDSLDHSVEAYISYIPYLATYDSSSGIGIKKVELTIDNPPADLYPGYTFSATINGESEDAYLMIPNSAVRSRRGQSYVIRRTDAGDENVNVSVRYLGEGLSQVLSGDIKPGDALVVNKSMTATEKMGNMAGGMGMPGGMPR